MSTSLTANLKFGDPATGDQGWGAVWVSNYAILDALAPIANLAVTTKEVPSSTLNVAVAAGSYVNPDGTVGTYAGTASQAIPAGVSRVLYLDLASAGALTVATAYPTTPHVRLATVVTGGSSISSIADNRAAFSVCGSWADGVNITLGTATGTQIGTATTQKLAFWGKTPVAQQTGGAATAGASYTATEQGMLNALYSMARTVGLLS